MNKTDLLADKLEKKETNIKNYFPNFTGKFWKIIVLIIIFI